MIKQATQVLVRAWCHAVALSCIAAGGAGAQATPPTPPAGQQDSAPPVRGRASWTADRIDLAIGDIVTVLIDERTLASALLTDNAADRRSKGMAFDVRTPASGGVPAAPIAAQFGSDNNGESRRTGQTVRQNAFQSEMSARVVAVSPTGMIQLRGKKQVMVDKSRQEVEISGWIRPQDVAAKARTVPSARLADAEIRYVQEGQLGKPKGGILGRILGMLWP